MRLKLKQLEAKYVSLVIEMAARGVTDRNDLDVVLRSYHQKGGAGDVLTHADEWIGRLSERRAASTAKAEQQAARRAEAKAAIAAADAKCDEHRGKRGWRLMGDFLEEVGTLAYTLDEIEQWAEWSFFKFDCRERPNLWAVFFEENDLGKQVCVRQIDRFWNPCARRARIDHAKAVTDLRDYIAERRARASGNN